MLGAALETNYAKSMDAVMVVEDTQGPQSTTTTTLRRGAEDGVASYRLAIGRSAGYER